MDFARISFGELVAAGSAAALFIFMFLPWYSGKASISVPGGGEFSASDNATAWEAFSTIDVLLCVVVLLAIAMLAARAAAAIPANLPAPPGLIVAAAGAMAVLLILYRLIDAPGAGEVSGAGIDLDIDRKLGIFLGLLAAAGISYGGYTAARERPTGEAPSAGPSAASSPPA